MKELITIWTAILLTFLLFGNTPPSNAQEDLQFGQYLEETQKEYRDLYRLQKSIAICEGGLNEQSLAWRNRNPGNLKAGGHTDNQGHTIYNNRLQGYLSHLSLLQRRYWGHTPLQMNKHYATDKNWYKCVNYYYYDYAQMH